jgi:hypothetical protein
VIPEVTGAAEGFKVFDGIVPFAAGFFFVFDVVDNESVASAAFGAGVSVSFEGFAPLGNPAWTAPFFASACPSVMILSCDTGHGHIESGGTSSLCFTRFCIKLRHGKSSPSLPARQFPMLPGVSP